MDHNYLAELADPVGVSNGPSTFVTASPLLEPRRIRRGPPGCRRLAGVGWGTVRLATGCGRLRQAAATAALTSTRLPHPSRRRTAAQAPPRRCAPPTAHQAPLATARSALPPSGFSSRWFRPFIAGKRCSIVREVRLRIPRQSTSPSSHVAFVPSRLRPTSPSSHVAVAPRRPRSPRLTSSSSHVALAPRRPRSRAPRPPKAAKPIPLCTPSRVSAASSDQAATPTAVTTRAAAAVEAAL